jgi:hypothetical protein
MNTCTSYHIKSIDSETTVRSLSIVCVGIRSYLGAINNHIRDSEEARRCVCMRIEGNQAAGVTKEYKTEVFVKATNIY